MPTIRRSHEIFRRHKELCPICNGMFVDWYSTILRGWYEEISECHACSKRGSKDMRVT